MLVSNLACADWVFIVIIDAFRFGFNFLGRLEVRPSGEPIHRIGWRIHWSLVVSSFQSEVLRKSGHRRNLNSGFGKSPKLGFMRFERCSLGSEQM